MLRSSQINGRRRTGLAPGIPAATAAASSRRSWCEIAGIKHITVFVCSTENLQRRGDAEVAYLMQVIEQLVADRLARPDIRWHIPIAGMLDVLPDTTARALKDAGVEEHRNENRR